MRFPAREAFYTLSAALDRARTNGNQMIQAFSAGVDSSEAALELARANAQRNGVADVCQFVRADVAEFMRAAAPQAWDIVVLDPPKLAPSRKVPRCQQMYPPCMPAWPFQSRQYASVRLSPTPVWGGHLPFGHARLELARDAQCGLAACNWQRACACCMTATGSQNAVASTTTRKWLHLCDMCSSAGAAARVGEVPELERARAAAGSAWWLADDVLLLRRRDAGRPVAGPGAGAASCGL